MLTRLQDRIETGADGEEIVVRRYGMWGTTAEIESKEEKFRIVYPDGKYEKFKRLKDAEIRLKELAGVR